MQVIFESRAADAASLRHLAVTRLQFVLRRMRWGVPRASLRLSDLNGPRGGVDKRCQVALTTDRGNQVVITAVAADWRTAVDQALARAARTLLRLWQRHRDQDRTPSRRLQRSSGAPTAPSADAPLGRSAPPPARAR